MTTSKKQPAMERKTEENWHIVGTIPETVAKHIGMRGKTPVWANDKIIQHIDSRHHKELIQHKTTALAFVCRVVGGFNSVYQQKDGTLVLAIENAVKSMVAYIQLEKASENYWRIKSAHMRDSVELYSYTLLWSKVRQQKKPVKRR